MTIKGQVRGAVFFSEVNIKTQLSEAAVKKQC